jgi:choline transporter-like protein 2/4/5
MGDSKDANWVKFGAIVIWSIGLISLMCLFCACKRIETAIQMLQVGSQFVRDNTLLIFAPMVWMAGFVVFAFIWIASSAYVFSVGEVIHKKGYAFGVIEWDTETTIYFWMCLWSFIWHSAIILCSLNFLITCSATLWYFAHNKTSPETAFYWTAFNWTFLKHWGSVVFSAVLIGTLWAVQIVMSMLIAMLKSDDKGGENKIAIWIATCFSCCLECFESCVTFLSNQSYVEISIKSISYIPAACASMKVILNYAVEFSFIHGAVACTSTFAVFTITCVTTIVGSLFLDHVQSQNLVQLETYSPKVFIFFCALVISKMFTLIYEIACDTVLHCFAYNDSLAPESFSKAKVNVQEEKYTQLKEHN